jgi:hypothetical protein
LRLLLDTCVWGGTKKELVAAGHDVVWCGDWESDPGDLEILAVAKRERRILNAKEPNTMPPDPQGRIFLNNGGSPDFSDRSRYGGYRKYQESR